jgi:hypothetical protein
MNGEQIFLILFVLIILGYIALYISGRKYLETFQNPQSMTGPTAAELYPAVPPTMVPASMETGSRPGRVVMETTSLDPVATEAIRSLDDYEYNMIFKNESDRELSQALRNKLISQRPMDWAGLPPSSEQFQAGLRESFQNATPLVPDSAQPYKEVSGLNMMPPDMDTVEDEERKILQSYKAPSTAELGSYNPDEEPEEMIERMYSVKGLIPTVVHKEGTNVYEIIGVRKKDEKILYEDEEAPASLGPVKSSGEANIEVPPAAYDMAAAKDPFYDAMNGGKTRLGKWDYEAWTPGLERMFAPTNPTQEWS